MRRFHIHVEKNDVYGSYDVDAENEEEARKKAINLFWVDINSGLSVRIAAITEVGEDGVPIGM